MAKKPKTKTGTRNKKNSKDKKKKLKTKAPLVKGIGVISTISIPQELRKAFQDGVNDTSVVFKYKHLATYKNAKLAKKIRRFNNDDDIGLIVTVGGLKAYEAAKSFATKPFVSLVGVAPTGTLPNKSRGGVKLNSYQFNSERVTYLTSKLKCDKTDIALLRNPNSLMAPPEEDNWNNTIQAGPITDAGNDTGTDENDASTYQGAFGSIPSGVKGLIISADPFFQDTKDELVDEANKWGKYVCYPLDAFGNASPKPKPGNATLYGPVLFEAYGMLGSRAKSVLDTDAVLAPPFAPADQHITELQA